ncbi:hypothetical protein G6F57_017479 [Rhizopus arrhizus]|nr:hypothetical protein G6F57_017479 [Rhizopus arrhizus]
MLRPAQALAEADQHFGRDQRAPRIAERQLRARDQFGHHGRQIDAFDQAPARGAHDARRRHVHALHGFGGVHHAERGRKERRQRNHDDDGRIAEAHHDQEQRHPGDRRNRLQDDDGAAQDFTKEEQHRGNQAEADPRRQRQAVACTQAAQGAQQALMERLLAQVFEQALHDGRHARHQEIRQRERCQLPQGKYEQDAQNARKMLAGAGHSGRRAQSLRASFQDRSTMLDTSYGLPSRVFSEPWACRMSAISCMRAVSFSVSLGVNTCVLIASVMTVSRGSSPRCKVLSVGSAMK